QPPLRNAEARPFSVQVVNPLSGGLDRTTTQPCTVHAFARAELYPVVSGVLTKQTVDIGDRVKKDQILAEIDAPLLALEEKQAAIGVRQAEGLVREAEAGVVAAKAEAQVARAVVQQRQAEVDTARANVLYRQRQLERVKNLLANRSVDERVAQEKEQ